MSRNANSHVSKNADTHTELLATCAVYREIVTSQLGAEAAA